MIFRIFKKAAFSCNYSLWKGMKKQKHFLKLSKSTFAVMLSFYPVLSMRGRLIPNLKTL